MAKLKVGFIGAGGIARGGHLPGYQALADDVKVVAATDVGEAPLKLFAEAAGLSDAQCFSDYRQMLDSVDLDLVSVCTPNSLHCKPTIDAFARGCHVLVEKPIAVSAVEARKMIEAGHAAGKLLMVGQSTRFTRQAQMMKKWVDEGLVGDIYWGRCQYLRQRGTPRRLGFVTRELSAGGPIYDLGVHVLDLALYLMDFPEPVSVSAGVYNRLASVPSPLNSFPPEQYTVPEDFAFSLIRFANGATLSLECSWQLNIPTVPHNVVLCGDRGGCEYNPLSLVTERGDALERMQPEIFHYPEPGHHRVEVKEFVEAILSGGTSPVPGEQALITQRILDAVYKSGEKGKEVAVR